MLLDVAGWWADMMQEEGAPWLLQRTTQVRKAMFEELAGSSDREKA